MVQFCMVKYVGKGNVSAALEFFASKKNLHNMHKQRTLDSKLRLRGNFKSGSKKTERHWNSRVSGKKRREK